MRRIGFKKIAVLLLAALLVTTISPVNDQVVRADTYTEAQEIETGTKITGSVESGSNNQQNIYTFTIPADGSVKLVFTNPRQTNDSAYWIVFLSNDQYEEIDRTEIYGNKAKTVSKEIGLAAGQYYVTVQSADYWSARSTSDYTFYVKYTKSDNWEKEFNEDFTSATRISPNQAVCGSIRMGSNEEKDYYSFKLKKSGYITVSLSHPKQSTSDGYWGIELYNKNYELIYSATASGNKKKDVLPQIGLAKGTYYVVVHSADYWSAMSTDKYKLKVGYKKSSYWEKEFNNDYTQADPMKIGKTYYGSTLYGSNEESDFFRFKASKKGKYSIIFQSKKQADSSGYWNITLYNADYEQVSSTTVPGTKTKTVLKQKLKKGTYYIKIESADYWSPKSESTWKLKVKK